MGNESDGDKTDRLKTRSLDNKNVKTRSHSVGSVNTLRQELNKTAGFDEIKKGSDTKTYLDKANKRKKTTNIGFNSIQDNSKTSVKNIQVVLVNDEENCNNLDYVFKPKNSVERTPPKSENTDGNIQNKTKEQNAAESNTQKRQRSDSSPEIFDRQKVRKPSELFSSAEHSLQLIENNKEPQVQKQKNEEFRDQNDGNNETKDCLENILEALKTINELSEMDDLTAISKEGGKNIRTATFKIHTLVTHLAYRVGQIEKYNIKPVTQVALNTIPNDTSSFPFLPSKENPLYLEAATIPKETTGTKKTYSTITNAAVDKQNAREREEKWVTPEQTKKHETIVRLKDQDNAKTVLKEIKLNLNKAGSFTETFKSVRQLQSGGVILECHNETQQRKLKETLEKQDNFQLRELQNTDPMLMITGIDKGYNPEKFVEELIEQNPQIKESFGNDIGSKIKVITKKECRNNKKENWILQTSPEVFRWLIRSDNISFDLMKAYIQEYNNIVMCYKCCYYGHVGKYCKGEVCCHKCSEKHEGKLCSENTPLNCPNCKRLNLKERRYNVKDPKCPAFLQKLKRQRLHTNYDPNIKEREAFLSQSKDQPNK